jgi:hypothetical protein
MAGRGNMRRAWLPRVRRDAKVCGMSDDVCAARLPVVGFEESSCALRAGHAGMHADEDGETQWLLDGEIAADEGRRAVN